MIIIRKTMSTPKRSPIALAVLAMLYEAPMHPYRMQRLIKERGKDEVINVRQRASLYQTIQRLDREGLISAQQTIRDAKRPERTVYEITERGRAIVVDWMREILSKPAMEYPEFPAAISFLPLLSPEDALHQLDLRASAIEAELHRTAELLKEAEAVPRLFLLEAEYVRAVQATELSWVKAVVEDLRAGRLTWSEDWLRQIAAQFSPDLASGQE
jgi:DNA-binding PadR family transcriptional regulator